MDQFLVSMINELYISEATTLKYECIYIYMYSFFLNDTEIVQGNWIKNNFD